MSKQKVFKISVAIVFLMMAILGLSAQEYSLLLNGDGQYANCGSSPDFNFTNALTVEAWIYPTDFKAEEHMNTIVAKTFWSFEFSHGWTFRYGSADRSLNFNMGAGEGISWIDCRADNVLTLNTWQHVAATYDGSNIRVYVNGTQVAAQAFSGGVVNADNDLCIGTINHSDLRYMTGKIDEVRIWNVVRSANEISDNVHHSVTSPNLVAYYKMDSGSGTVLTDDSGNGHTADVIGSPTWTVELPREYSLQLNGTNQYVDCGANFPFYGNSNLTLEAWIYPTYSTQYYLNPIVSKNKIGGTSGINGWYFTYKYSSKTLSFTIDPEGIVEICSADNVLSLDTWQHVAVTYDHSAIKLYVNGLLVATRNCTISLPTDNANLFIGRASFESWNRYASGYLDEVRIWSCARTASQIADNRFQSVSDPYLLAYYQMSNGAGTRLTDNSGHGRPGTLYMSPTWSTQFPLNKTFVSTQPTTSITNTSATANGTIEYIGSANLITYGHCWSHTASEPNLDPCGGTNLGPVTDTGSYTSAVTGLIPQTHYWIRAYAVYMEGGFPTTTYGNVTEFSTTATPPPTPYARTASSIATSGFTANWSGSAWYVPAYNGYSGYDYMMDVSTDSSFNSFVDGYNNRPCGSHSYNSNYEYNSTRVTGLVANTTYYYRIRSFMAAYSPYSATIEVTTLSTHNVSYNTGNITGVHIFSADTDFGIDPPSPLVLPQGYSGTIQAEKADYVWNLAEGSDSNIITSLAADRTISFVGTYSYVDESHSGFIYTGDPDIPLTAALCTLGDLAVSAPPNTTGDAIVVLFTGTTNSDITITLPNGTWYVIAYYNDPAHGGLAWHHADLYPADGPGNIVFANVPFGAKSETPVIISGEDTTLPVEFCSFTAIVTTDQDVTLSWTTQSETNLSGFTLLRSSTNSLGTAICISYQIPATNSSQLSAYTFTDTESEAGFNYSYWLLIRDLDGCVTYHGPICVTVGNQGGNEPPAIPLQTRLLPSSPNPFNPTTTIHYELSEPETATFAIYNTKGQLIYTRSQTHGLAGDYHWVFNAVDQNGRALSSGVYYCVMYAGKHVLTNKMVLMK